MAGATSQHSKPRAEDLPPRMSSSRSQSARQNGFALTRLPHELQDMTWHMTLPEPRVIEVVELYPDTSSESSEDEGDWLRLQLAGSLSTFLQTDLAGRTMDEEPFELCPAPIALQVCNASRAYTLRRYIRMVDPVSDSWSFYFNPRRDFLWLSVDASDEGPERLAGLRQHYGQQVDLIENILVEEKFWCENDVPPTDYAKLLDLFKGLRVVRILMESYQFEDQPSTDPAIYPALANKLAERDSAVLGARDWILEYIDQTGTIYRQVSLRA